MANRFNNPFPEFYDDTGTPREGARLFFYQSGTVNTKLDTYSDSSLSVANLNPVTLDEFGRPPAAIFLKNQDYKVVLAQPGTDDPPSNTIWTADPVRASDYAIFSIRKTGSGNPNGLVAGTAGSAGVLPTEYWDYTNGILYVCTTSGTTLTAVWTALNSTSAGSFFSPAGRLTPTSNTPVISSDVISGANVYWTPYGGNAVPVYNGSTFVMRTFAELTLALSASHAISTLYDVFLFDDNGTLTTGTGPAWNTSTAGAGARGTGASTTELTKISGLNVNAVAMTARNGATTYSVGANLGLLLGTIAIDTVAGQLTCHVSAGASRKFGISNVFNRRNQVLRCLDATASWNYSSATIRQSRANAGNTIAVLSCLPEEEADLSFHQRILNTSGGADTVSNYIGVNSTTVASGTYGFSGMNTNSMTSSFEAKHTLVPFIGLNNINALESAQASGTQTFFGTESFMMLKTKIMA